MLSLRENVVGLVGKPVQRFQLVGHQVWIVVVRQMDFISTLGRFLTSSVKIEFKNSRRGRGKCVCGVLHYFRLLLPVSERFFGYRSTAAGID